MSNEKDDNWNEYRRLVLNELERLDQAITKLAESLLKIEREFTSYKVLITDKIASVKESSIDKMREINLLSMKELGDQERTDINSLTNKIDILEERIEKMCTEFKVLKGKAALLGFLSGLVMGIISLILTYLEIRNG